MYQASTHDGRGGGWKGGGGVVCFLLPFPQRQGSLSQSTMLLAALQVPSPQAASAKHPRCKRLP
eukprot:4931641-Prorocentrum_lima.AAC.1